MNPELDAALVRDFPNLYRDRHGSSRYTGMCWGFPEDGWEPLLRRLSEKLEPIASKTDLRAVQVKEKFGGLRFYVNSDGDGLTAIESKTLYEAIDAAIEESAHTCELCGASGTNRKIKGWWKTLCPTCANHEAI
jgi:hypothetical protein